MRGNSDLFVTDLFVDLFVTDLFVRRDWYFGDVAFYGLKVSWRCR
jgi:hypothetical protein